MRILHRWVALPTLVLLIVLSLTGAILSVFPLLSQDRTADRLNVGALVAAVQEALPGVEQILVDDNGVVTAVAFGANGIEQMVIDPATGAVTGPVTQSGVELWFENLHRALFLSDTGHLLVLGLTAAMLVLTVSGYALAARRLGGWRNLMSRDRGAGAGGLHLKIARVAGVGLLISTLSGLWMGAATLGLIPDNSPMADYPTTISTETPVAADHLAALTALSGDDLRSISLPREGVTGQAYAVEVDAGAGYVDPVTGEMLTWQDRGIGGQVMDLMHLLHTGQGAAVLGLVLGVMALSVPILGGSGLLVWAAGRGSKLPKVRAQEADTVILVGSEGGTTWRFARAVARWLAGQKVHVAAMNDYAPDQYHKCRSLIIMTATYGEGDAPESADRFLSLIAQKGQPKAPVSLLAFGDSSYPAYCGYAAWVAEVLGQADFHRVDRQSMADFTAWGADYAPGLPDVAALLDPRPATALRLIAKTTYGEEAQATTTVLRFALPRLSLIDRLLRRDFGGFVAGDLLNVVPNGDDRPRSYSLASGTRDGFVEICVRKAPGGLASGQLCALEVGETVNAYISRNAAFHAPEGIAPIVLIGAGAGVGALAGFIRANRSKTPMHLYFGTRTRKGGYPFDADLARWESSGQLSNLTLALSRGDRPRYVQQTLLDDAALIRDLAAQGARFMICGGRDMADGVRAAMDVILAPARSSVPDLLAEGRYAVDAF